MKKNKNNSSLNLIIYIMIGLIVVVGIIMLLPSGEEEEPTTNPPIQDEIIFTTTDSNITLKIGEERTINYSLSGNYPINWYSSNNNVVMVTNGVITGISYGTSTVTGTVNYNGIVKSISCNVSIYEGEIGVNLVDVKLPEGALLIGVNQEYELPITYEPANAYINSMTFSISAGGIISFTGRKIKALAPGECDLSIKFNNNITKTFHVIVTNEVSSGQIVKVLEKLILSSGSITITKGETKKIEYRIEPTDAYISSTLWESNNNAVVSVNDGIITGVSEGEATITLTVNSNFVGKINVKVNPAITSIDVTSGTSINMKIGDTSQIKYETVPKNSNATIIYKTNNGNVSVSNTGLIKALKSGSSVVTVSSEDGKVSKKINVTVYPKSGVISGEGIWAYTDSKVVNPVRAGSSFFQGLANKGIGKMSGDTYTYSKYSYNYSNSTLTCNGRSSMVRIYYPSVVDLSSVNTFTFIGGAGERNWGSFFSAIDKDTSLIKSSGIIILVSARSSYHEQDAINATEFVKAIVKQKSGMRNSVAGYSMGGPAAGKAAYLNNYDRLLVVNSYVNASDLPSLKNKEIYIYSPNGDSMYHATKGTLLHIHRDGGFKNVTVITNNSEIINNYGQSTMLIVNPGSSQGYGHGYTTIVRVNMFAFACK